MALTFGRACQRIVTKVVAPKVFLLSYPGRTFYISSGVSKGIYKSVVQRYREFLNIRVGVSGREKPSDASYRWRCTKAMTSTKVGDGLSYQAARRWVMGLPFFQRVGSQVAQM